MFDEEDRETGYALFLAVGLAIVVSIFTIGIAAGTAIGQIGKRSSAAAALPASIAAAAASAVRLYFEPGKSDLPVDALTQISPLVMEAKDRGGRWVVSGFHDASGDAAANAELAKQRALAVRDLLTHAGVSAESIELAKPRVTTGGADPREARRVEVMLR